MLRSLDDVVLVLVLAVAALLSFAELVPTGLRANANSPFLGLAVAAVILALAGRAVMALCDLHLADGNFALQIGIGQVALLIWFFLRSAFSAVVTHFAGISLPISRIEIFILVCLLVFSARKKASIWPDLAQLPSLAWAGVAMFLIAQRELPRELMLSSDPDQHLFFAHQILKLGVVPFDLGMWGPRDFNYPAGFAALCSLWSWMGGVSAADAVASQPLLQTLLALLAISSMIASYISREDMRLKVIAGFITLLLFFGFFPYSLTRYSFLLEKTGSISSLLLLVSTLALAAYGWAGPPLRSRAVALLMAGASVGLAALLNPVAAIVPGLIYGCAVCKRLWEKRRDTGILVTLAVLYVIAPLSVVFTDPYYLFRILQHRQPTLLVPVNAVPPNESLLVLAGQYAAELLSTHLWTKPFLQVSFFGLNAFSIAPLALAAAIIYLLLPPRRRLALILPLALVPFAIIVLEFTLVPLFYGLRSHGDLYLLAPYLLESLVRAGYLWYMTVLLLALTLLCARGFALRMGPAISVVLAALAMLPVRIARDNLDNQVQMTPRYGQCNVHGCVTDDDRVILQALRDRFDAYVGAGGSMEFNAIPKVLLPNALLNFSNENWIMPIGAALAIPLISTFPAAFFYFQGSSDYSYANYEDHVCRKLDIPWLMDRNIRFLFVPENRKGVCVAGLESLLKQEKVVARSGNSVLVELY